jgi:hypothetical protein
MRKESYMNRFLYALVTLTAMLSLSLGATSAAQAGGGEAWKIIPSPTPAGSTSSSFSSVAAVSPRDVWGVGYWRTTTANAPLIEHWNGSRWKIIANPTSVTTGLVGVSADAANDAWAVGYNFAGSIEVTLVEHWNGTGWSIVPSPNPADATGSRLLAVTALSPSNAWAVGLYTNQNFNQLTLIEHWNGQQWSIVSSPNQPAANALYSITALSRNNIWAVGSALTSDVTSDTLVEHWDGVRWSIVPSPDGGSFNNFLNSVAAASATSVWAVGSYSPQASGGSVPSDTLIEHWDGTQWSVVASQNVAGAPGSFLSGVAVVSPRDVWAVGYVSASQTTALIEHWNGVKWRIVAGPTGTNESHLNAVVHVPGTETAWAVGEMGGFALTEFRM